MLTARGVVEGCKAFGNASGGVQGTFSSCPLYHFLSAIQREDAGVGGKKLPYTLKIEQFFCTSSRSGYIAGRHWWLTVSNIARNQRVHKLVKRFSASCLFVQIFLLSGPLTSTGSGRSSRSTYVTAVCWGKFKLSRSCGFGSSASKFGSNGLCS